MSIAETYLKHVQMRIKAGTKGVRLRWTKDTVGGVDRWVAPYDGGNVVIYAPAKHFSSLYQVYANNEHFSNADTLAEAKATGVRAAAYYMGKAPNMMGRTYKAPAPYSDEERQADLDFTRRWIERKENPRSAIGGGAPRGLWGRAVDALAAFKRAGNAWRDAGRPRSGPLYADFVAAEREYNPLRDEVDRWDWNDEQRAEWERVNRAFDPLLPGQQGYKANPRKRKPARRRNPEAPDTIASVRDYLAGKVQKVKYLDAGKVRSAQLDSFTAQAINQVATALENQAAAGNAKAAANLAAFRAMPIKRMAAVAFKLVRT